MAEFRYLSICSGIEAASVAWKHLGWTAAGYSEIEPFPRAVLQARFDAEPVDWDHRHTAQSNMLPLFGDFTKIEEHHVGPIDLLVGGTPCQSFSVAGKRLGLDDPRGHLTLEYLALAKRLRPRWVVWENVPGVLSDDEGRTLGTFLRLLGELGYRWADCRSGQHRMTTWPFGDLKMFGYQAIIADPPWHFRNYSEKGETKNPSAHYACMSTKDIAAMPVSQLAAPDCALIMWATAPMLPDAVDLMKAWGFTFKSAGAWAKQSSTGKKWAFGTGYCFRSAAEFFLLGTIGKPKIKSRSVRNLIVSPVREHSRKPEDQYQMVEQLFDGPYAEVFSRANRAGWDSFGDEAGKFNTEEADGIAA